MEYNGLPEKQGLYDPQFEHDACGIGFIANIKGKTSHGIINQAIQILKNLAHRGGVGSEPDTGDGAGILIQMPHAFMKKVCKMKGLSYLKRVITALVCCFYRRIRIQEKKVLKDLQRLLTVKSRNFSV